MVGTQKGKFIVIDGPDGSGKTTQAELLVQRLRESNFPAEHYRDPGDTPLGEQIRLILLDPLNEIGTRAEALLFIASRAQLVEEKIRPALAEGKVVVCERYHSSTLAYQGTAGALGTEMVEKVCHFATGDLHPDITLILDVDPIEGLKRIEGKKDRLEMRGVDYHQQVRQGYLQYALAHPGSVILVEGGGSPEETGDKIWGTVAGIL